MHQGYQSARSPRNHVRLSLGQRTVHLSRRSFRLILSWRRHLAASLFKTSLPEVVPVETPTENGSLSKEDQAEKDDEDEDDQDIEEQLLKLNEQQRKEAKRYGSLSSTFAADLRSL